MNEKTQQLVAQGVTSDAATLAAELNALAAAALTPHEVHGAHFALTPPGYTQHELTAAVEKAQPQPTRKRGTVHLRSVDSLVQVLADQVLHGGKDTGYVYADPDARTITAVFNDNRATAGWRDFRAIYKAEHTPEFARWLSHNGANAPMTQSQFAEFVEDNLADITEPYAQQLLAVATTIQATSGIEFKSAKRLHDGQTQLTYAEHIEARAGADGSLSIPKEFTLGLRIFKNGGGYLLKARLKYRMAAGTVKFWYELDRPERAVEDAFAGYVEEVRTKSGYTVLLGAAG